MADNAPYSGGLSPGAVQFAVDGDFTSCDPCGPPKITFPFQGDSVFSNQDILFYSFSSGDYEPVQLGTSPNISPWSPNQAAFIIEQEFMVAMEDYIPMSLNTPYDDIWAIGWTGVLTSSYPLPDLSAAVLIDEGQPTDMGQGIVKIVRRFATIPPTRNDVEQFVYTFPGIANGRVSFSRNVVSRLQYDYFIFDDLDLLAGIPLFPAGQRLDSGTGLYPAGLILPAQYYYAAAANAVQNNYFLDPSELTLSDGSPGTIPSVDDWLNYLSGSVTSNGQPPELIAEASTLKRWQGNIYERRTRFVLVQ
jgi:hypothetical protein